MASADECTGCPAGKYCVNGNITGDCSPGFLCIQSGSATPPSPFDDAVGGPCPSGHYCPAGTLAEVPCPDNKVFVGVGARNASMCTACPEGYECNFNIPYKCKVGYYCPYNVDPVPCNSGTYNPIPGGTNMSACMPCPAGYRCNSTAISDYSSFLCPARHYCPEGLIGEPIPCPSGTYRPLSGGGAVSDCTDCPTGMYCEEASSSPVACQGGTYCPSKSAAPIVCPGGSYCPFMIGTPIQCPPNFHCPEGTSDPIACDLGEFCPAGTAEAFLCPLGMAGVTGLVDRQTETAACTECPAGRHGAHPSRAECVVCRAGFVCLGRTKSDKPLDQNVDNGYECPVGHYCPEGSFREIACPKGTYQSKRGAFNATECLKCPANSYSVTPGASSCYPCGASAYSAEGASICTCLGAHRAYQSYDGSCRCMPGYTYFDEYGQEYDGNSAHPCIPIVRQECLSNQVRNSMGDCVNEDDMCLDACIRSDGSVGDGVFDVDIGVCDCPAEDLDEVCDSSCRLGSTIIRTIGNDKIQVQDPQNQTNTATVDLANIPGFFGSLNCEAGQVCELTSVVADSRGHTAVYGLLDGLAAYLVGSGSGFSPQARSLQVQSSIAGRRHFQTMSLDGTHNQTRHYETQAAATAFTALTQPGFTNPTVCMRVGDGVFFEIKSPQNYPVYAKDSALNTNPDFDYSLFRELGDKLSRGLNITSFAFSFDQAGTYVFSDKSDASKQEIFVIIRKDQECPTKGKIVGTTSTNLVALGVFNDKTIVTAPKLTTLGLLIGLFVIFAFGVALYARLKLSRARRASLALNSDLNNSSDNFRLLYLELRDQKRRQEQQLNNQKENFKIQCDRICGETEQLKALLSIKMTDGQGVVQAASTLLLREVTARDVFTSRQKRREDNAVSLLHSLLEKLEKTPVLSTDVISDSKKAIDAVTELEEAFKNENLRRTQAFGNATIIGEDIMEEMAQGDSDLESKTKALLDPLLDIQGQIEKFRSQMISLDVDLEDAKAEYADRALGPQIQVYEERHKHQQLLCVEMFKPRLASLLRGISLKQENLKKARARSSEDCNNALDTLEEKKREVSMQTQQGLFHGLSDELASAVRLFLGEAYRTVAPGMSSELGSLPPIGIEAGDDDETESVASEDAEEEQAREKEDFDDDFLRWKESELEKKRQELMETISDPAEIEEKLRQYARVLEAERSLRREKLDAKVANRELAREIKPLVLSIMNEEEEGFDDEVQIDVKVSEWKERRIQQKKEELDIQLEENLVGADEATAKELIAKHEYAMGRYETLMASQANTQKEKLAARLAARKAKRAGAQQTKEEFLAQQNKDIVSREGELQDEFVAQARDMAADAGTMKQMYEDMQRKNELLQKLLREEQEKQMVLADAYLEDDVSDPHDRETLAKLKKALKDELDRQKKERDAIVDSSEEEGKRLVAEELADLADTEARIKREQEQLQETMNFEKSQTSTQEEKEKVVSWYTRLLHEAADNLEKARTRSHANLFRINENIKVKRIEALKRLAAENQSKVDQLQAELARFRTSLEAKQASGVAIEMTDIDELHKVLSGAAEGAREQARVKFFQEQQEQLVKAQQEAAMKLNKELESDMEKELSSFEGKFDAWKQQTMEEKEKELIAATKHADAAKADQMMQAHAKSMSEFSSKLDVEKDRQKNLLQEKLAARKRQRQNNLKKEQAAELKRELKAQEKDIEAVVLNSMAKREETILAKMLSEGNRHRAKGIIEKVLKARHQKETMTILHDHLNETTAKLHEALTEVFAEASKERTVLDAQFSEGEITKFEFDIRKNEIDDRLDEQVVRQTIQRTLAPKHQAELSALKNTHIEEVKKLMLKFYPDETFSGSQWTMGQVDVEKLFREQELKRQEEEKKLAQQLEQLENAQKKKQQEMEQAQKRKLQELEAKLEQQNRDILARHDEEERKLQQKMERQRKKKLTERISTLEKDKVSKAAGKMLSKMKGGENQDFAAIVQNMTEKEAEEKKKAEEESQRKRQNLMTDLERRKEKTRQEEIDRIKAEMDAIQQQQEREKKQEADRLLAERGARKLKVDNLILVAAKQFYQEGMRRQLWRQRGVELALKKFKRAYRLGAAGLREKKRRAELKARNTEGFSDAVLLTEFPGIGQGGEPFMEKLNSIEAALLKLQKVYTYRPFLSHHHRYHAYAHAHIRARISATCSWVLSALVEFVNFSHLSP